MYKNSRTSTTVANNAAELLLGLSLLSAVSGASVVIQNPSVIDPYPLNTQIFGAISAIVIVGLALTFHSFRGASIYTIATSTIERGANSTPTIPQRQLPPSYQNFMKTLISCDPVRRVTAHSLSDNSIGFKVVLKTPIITPMMRLKMRGDIEHTYHRGGHKNVDGYVLWIRAY